MLRLLVLLLLLLNMSYLAWSEGLLLAYGWGPTPQREPQRLAQQVRPEAIVVLRTQDAAAALASPSAAAPPVVEPERTPVSAPLNTVSAATPASTSQTTSATTTSAPSARATRVCILSNPLDATQVQTLQPLLADKLAQSDWSLDEQVRPARWLIYMGRFANANAQAAKREQLLALKVKFEPVDVPSLAPGFMLGAFSTRSATESALQALNKRGVRTAKMTQVQTEQTSYRLRLPALDPALSALQQIKAAVPDMLLQPCPAPTTN